jgi:hypothetical protein
MSLAAHRCALLKPLKGLLMAFNTTERASLLKVKGVGPTVVKR